MYHEATLRSRAYYDTFEELPKVAKVYFPDSDEPKEMNAKQVCALDNEGWFTIMHSVNWGCCDHWTSEKPSKWVRERFEKICRYIDNQGNTIGYNRESWHITLTRNGNYWKSEVWNS